MSSRHRPLYTCGISILAIAQSACGKAQGFNGPISSTTRRVAQLASLISPLVYAMLHQWLAILSFVDDQILAVANVVEEVFPPSNFVFKKVDYLVQIIETLPETFDDGLDKFPATAHRDGFDCALVQVVSWLFHSGSENTWEKEILVDEKCPERNDEPVFVDEANKPAEYQANVDSEKTTKLPPISETQQAEGDITKGTFKEAVEKGGKENTKKESREKKVRKKTKEQTYIGKEEAATGEGKIVEKSNERIVKDEVPILELFESGWLKNPGRGA